MFDDVYFIIKHFRINNKYYYKFTDVRTN